MVKNLAIKCRGLPFSCTEDDLRKFLGDSGIENLDLPIRDGKAMGEATVTYNNDRDYNEALKKDHEYMGHRWIEVFPADQDGSKKPRPRNDRERDRGDRDRGRFSGPEERFGRYGEACIRIRGLPYSARENDVFDFFRGIPMLSDGVLLAEDPKAVNGEAFVVFEDERGARSAKALHMKSMGRRYIEIFDASYSEMVRFCHDNRLRVPRPPPPGGVGYGYDSPFAQSGYSDRRAPAPGPLPFDNYTPSGSDPYYGSGAAAGGVQYGGRLGNRADPHARPEPYVPPREEPYGLGAPAADPYARPRDDPFARRAYDDAYGRPGYPPSGLSDPYARPIESTWRDERPPPPPSGYAPPPPTMDSYGYGEYAQQGSGGGPMKREAAAPHWRASEYDRPADAPRGRERPGQRYVLKMRGVPFRAVESDVYEFFDPIRPSRVEIVREPGGRPSGEARVEFESRKDYDEALLKDKKYMGQRYVELFPDFGGRY